MKPKTYRFYEPIYFANVEVEFKKENRILSATVGQYERRGLVYYTMSLEDNKDFYTLMHECLHLVCRIFTDRGIPFVSENQEAMAYYQCYWFKRIWRKINET